MRRNHNDNIISTFRPLLGISTSCVRDHLQLSQFTKLGETRKPETGGLKNEQITKVVVNHEETDFPEVKGLDQIVS